ncbi:MAG TPA: flagellar basal body rod protein FlgB [Pirellulales bacterium]|jgi:flagellar basal-body rod protein FlgB|nr:flagellar basal body rod protein FlgB [Pirellulales bacterium]
MITSLFDATTIPVLEQVANFATARHDVLAGNLANLDTPGYLTRDLSPAEFQSRLKQALVERDQARSLPSTPGSEAYGVTSAASPSESVYEIKNTFDDMLRHDNDNVSLERQVAEINKNQMQHSLALTIMSSQFRLLQAAISEKA